MGNIEGFSPEVRDRVFEAVQAELRGAGLDRFSIDGVARRAGVDPEVIRRQWHDRRVLLMDVMLERTAASNWNPDTGSLYTDLEAVSALAVRLSQTPGGRDIFRRVLPSSGDMDLGEIGSDLWEARFRDAAQVLQRAADRGQLRDGIVPDEAIRMFAAAFYYDVIFSDSPVRPEYASQVMDIFLHGILGAAGRDRPWPALEKLLGNPDQSDGVVLDQAVESARRAAILMRVWADALPDPVVLLEAIRDENRVVVDFVCREANRAACDQAGLPRFQIVGTSVVSRMPNFSSSGMLRRYADCVDSGEPLVLNDFLFQLAPYEQQLRFDLRATTAGADLITVTWRDVTERFEAAQIDARYRKLMDFSAVPAALATPGGQIVSANQAMATMLGYDIPTLLTMGWQDFTAPETIEEETEVVADMLAGRRDSYRAIKQYVHADGHRVWADLSLSCIRRPDGEVENLIAQIIDITEFRRA